MTRLPNALRVTGTASDPDATGPVTVRLSVNGTVGANAQIAANKTFTANLSVVAGSNNVCAVAVNRNRGFDVQPGCRRVTVSVNPFGSVDGISAAPAGLRVQGWATDPDTAASIAVHVYVDGVGWAFSASTARGDVASAYEGKSR